MIIRSGIENSAAKQLALDMCCNAEDFFKYENTLTKARLLDGRRCFTKKPNLFRAVTMGMGAVISAEETVAEYAKVLVQSVSGTELFEAQTISAINRELFSHKCCIGVHNQYYLPTTPYRPSARREGYSLSVFDQTNIEELYQYKGFDNALLYDAKSVRRDILAVCAINGRRIMGMAGASLDSPLMAQIGIDVLPEFRGMGIASALVSACTGEVFRSGYVPYYGTWSGNIISQRLAAQCGYVPAWCEICSVEIK